VHSRSVLEKLQEISGAFLLRVRSNLAPKVIKRISVGSALVLVKIGKGKKAILVREIRGACAARAAVWLTCAFDEPSGHPPISGQRELLGLYARRWEQELMYRQLKVDMRQSPVLNSHTVHYRRPRGGCLDSGPCCGRAIPDRSSLGSRLRSLPHQLRKNLGHGSLSLVGAGGWQRQYQWQTGLRTH